MLISVHKNQNNRQLSSRIHQMRCLHPLPSKKSRYSVEHGRGINILFSQIVENFQMKRSIVPFVRLAEINCDLDSKVLSQFIGCELLPFRPALQEDKERCWQNIRQH